MCFFKNDLLIYFWLHWVLLSTGFSFVVASLEQHGLCCSVGCGIFLDQGLNLCPLHWQADSQPLHLQRNPMETYIYRKEHDFFKGLTLPFQKLFLFFALLEETPFTPRSPVQLGSLPQPRGLNFSLFLNPPRASGSPQPPPPESMSHW